MNDDINSRSETQEELEQVQNGSEEKEVNPQEGAEMSVPEQDCSTDEVSEWKDKYMRLVAEFDNYKKRTSRERMDLIQLANKDLMLSLLEVVDDMDRAQAQIENTDDADTLKEGVQLVFNKFRKTLTDKGLNAYDSKGQDFDVEVHEAITEIPAPSEDMKGKVVDEVLKGYHLNDKLLRHAKVVVGK